MMFALRYTYIYNNIYVEREKQKKKGRERELGGRENRKIDCEVRVRVVWKKRKICVIL